MRGSSRRRTNSVAASFAASFAGRFQIAGAACCAAWCAACATPHVDWSAPLIEDARAHYPELRDTPIRVVPESEPYVGGRALFAPSAIFGGDRDYEVRMAPALVDPQRGCPAEGRTYVAVHELAHIFDYWQRDGAGLVAFLAEIAITPWRSERRADVFVVARGFESELAAYRRWQREWMKDAPDQLAARKRNYFTPNEARAAAEVRDRCPDVFAAFAANPPRDLREILRRCP